MAANSQLLTTESKKQTKQSSRTETESQIWRSLGWWPVGMGGWRNGGKGEEIKKYRWVVTKWAEGC